MTAEEWLTANGFKLNRRTWEKRIPLRSPFDNLQFIKFGGGWALGTGYRCHYDKIYKHPSEAFVALLGDARKGVENIDADVQGYAEKIQKERTEKLTFVESLVADLKGNETV